MGAAAAASAVGCAPAHAPTAMHRTPRDAYSCARASASASTDADSGPGAARAITA